MTGTQINGWYRRIYLQSVQTFQFRKKLGGYKISAEILEDCPPKSEVYLVISDSWGEAYKVSTAKIIKDGHIKSTNSQGKSYILPIAKWKKLENAVEVIEKMLNEWMLIKTLAKRAERRYK